LITVILPMAGLGSRFGAAGEVLPKPLIEVAGMPMFCLALNAVRREHPDASVVAIVLADHQRSFGIADSLAAVEPSIRVAVVPALTGGSLQTCLAAESLVSPDDAVVVLDCDLTFTAPAYFRRLRAIHDGDDAAAGVLLSFRSREPRYSYAEVVGDRVVRTAEKQPISDHALIGAYGFGSARTFFAVAHDIVSRDHRTGNGEFYVSSAFNRLIAQGQDVRLVDADSYWSMGTPEELRACLSDPDFSRHAEALRGVRAAAAAS